MKQYFSLQYWKGQRFLLLAFLLVHVAVAAIHISCEGITTDEPDYYTYAVRWIHGKVERTNKIYDSKSSIVAVALIPRIIKQLQQPGYKTNDDGKQDVKNGRYFMVVFTIIIALYLFVWIRKLFGAKAWIFPLLFFLFDPMVISFSMIITSDIATGACIIATLYHFWRFYKTKAKKHFILFSAWLGISFVCKASLLFLLPCLGLLYFTLVISRKAEFNPGRLVVFSLIAAIISLLIINIAYFGKGSFHSLKGMHFESKAFQSIAKKSLVSSIPVPVPQNYIEALDLLQYHKEIGAGNIESSYPGVFLNGETRYYSGFWYYYIYVGFFKIPIATLSLIIAGFCIFLFRFNCRLFVQKYIWFVFPALFFFILLSFFNKFQLGLRHLLMIYPLFFIGIAALLCYWQRKFRYTHFISCVLFGFMIFSMSRFPDLIAYTNEFAGDKKNVYKKIRDASIDYGQNEESRQKYLAEHPDTRIPGSVPQPGKYIVRVRELFKADPGSTKPKYLWLLNFNPVAHYKHSLLIYEISGTDIKMLK